ncbi:NUMOD4 domain-containing protein [Erwinia sp. HR93]|uniref:NUMOD4 domain-containing protein n=1 Tax=Erwinia sp. HR93 TaxID=3094840 RepID=UPI002ADED993|nr:NUMOD4 domain-containing protein [Erwinia sp. HR93]MEA1064721.1 NUMOD4 domain-containing protein [Erwinia sp. HR93]
MINFCEKSERWRPVVNFEGLYEVSNFGRVRSVSRWVDFGKGRRLSEGRLLTISIKGAYKNVCLCNNGVELTKTIHRLVAEAFVAGTGKVVRHLDGNSLNNHADNLAWGSYQDNENDKARHGRTLKGEKHHNAKLTREDVINIRQMHARGMTQLAIAAALCIGRGAVGCVVRGETWEHIE